MFGPYGRYQIIPGVAMPNASHLLAVELAKRRKLRAVVTQNIDGLYPAAGLDTSYLIELHWTITTSLYSRCHLEHDRYKAHQTWKSGVAVPTCHKCGSPLRFGTVAFGEPLSMDALEQSKMVISDSDLLLIMGTSLVVQPANKLPEIALDKKIPIVLLNLGPTPLDRVVDLLILNKCGITAQHVLNHIDQVEIASTAVALQPPNQLGMPLHQAALHLVSCNIVEGIVPSELFLKSCYYRQRKMKFNSES